MSLPSVVVLSYFNDPNFGDRLGYHLINSILPPNALVRHASILPWSAPDGPIDLLVVGIGNSLNAATVRRDELYRLMDRAKHVVGIFGTQYRYQYTHPGIMPTTDRFAGLLDRLTMWFARYERDIREFGAARKNLMHLGDWLITAFPLAQWTDPRTLVVPPEIKTREFRLDRFIQQLQAHRRVSSARLHPLLCALTSAEEVSYREQTEDPKGTTSGKFAAMLEDVFGVVYPENEFWSVDREKVIAYKEKVARNVETLRATLDRLLGYERPSATPAC
jgi:hypothetical protein